MQIGDLVKDSRGNVGIITFDWRQGFTMQGRKQEPQPHVWVHWCDGGANSVHIRHLEAICK